MLCNLNNLLLLLLGKRWFLNLILFVFSVNKSCLKKVSKLCCPLLIKDFLLKEWVSLWVSADLTIGSKVVNCCKCLSKDVIIFLYSVFFHWVWQLNVASYVSAIMFANEDHTIIEDSLTDVNYWSVFLRETCPYQ